MAASLPIHSAEAEAAVIGATLLTGRSALEALTLELGLRPEHFYRPQHAEAFSATCVLADKGREIDTLTLQAELRSRGTLDLVGGAAGVDALAACAPAAGNAREYAAVVIKDAQWRQRQAALRAAHAAVERLDEEGFSKAQAELLAPAGERARLQKPTEQASELMAWFSSREPDTIPTPFTGLDRLLGDGLRRGDSTVIATWTSWGKSVLAAQLLRYASARGFRVCCYSNEMSSHDYALRSVASLSGVPFAKLLRKSEHRFLSPQENRRILAAFEALNVPVQRVAGWSGTEIVRHIRRSQWDLWAVDYLHKIPFDGVKELDQITAALTSVAVETNSHGLLVSQLNQERNKGAELPRPVRRDLRGSGALQNDPANILMIARDQEEVQYQGRSTGVWRPLPPSTIYLEKQRNGALGGIAAWMDENRMMFTEEAA